MSGRKIPYPWGRIRPEKRISEIVEMIEKMHKQKVVLEDQYNESIRKIDMNIKALSDQIEVARSFQKEDLWSALRERVYSLEIEGIGAMGAIYGKSLSEAETIVADLESRGVVKDRDLFVDSDNFSSSLDDIGNLFEGD